MACPIQLKRISQTTFTFKYFNLDGWPLQFCKSGDRLGIFVNDYNKNKGLERLSVVEALSRGIITCDGNFTPDEIKFALTSIAKTQKNSMLAIRYDALYVIVSLGLNEPDITERIIPDKIINFPIFFWNVDFRNTDLAIADLKKFKANFSAPELICLSECKIDLPDKEQFFGNYYTVAGRFSDGPLNSKSNENKYLIIYKRVSNLDISFQKIKLTGKYLETASKTWKDTPFDNKEYVANTLKCFIGGQYVGLIEFIHYPSPLIDIKKWKEKLLTDRFRTTLKNGNDEFKKEIMIGDWNVDLNEKPSSNPEINKVQSAFLDKVGQNVILPNANATYEKGGNIFDWVLIPNNKVQKNYSRLLLALKISQYSDHNAILLHPKQV